jgi:hypothetical protein
VESFQASASVVVSDIEKNIILEQELFSMSALEFGGNWLCRE